MNSFFTTVLLLALLAGTARAAGQAPDSPPSSAKANPVPAPTGTMGTLPPAAGPEYRLGAGDKIRVEVYKEEQFSQSLQVRPDGKVTIPFAGDLLAAGLTPIELRDRVTTALKAFLNNPVVTVMVVEALASSAYIIGEVNKPGTIALAGPTTIIQALAMAGGFRDFANTKDIRVLRQGPNGVETLHFNYKGAVNRSGDTKMLYLQRGDTVIVQ